MVLAMVLAMPAWAQKEKNHDFVVAKNMDVFTSIYKNLDMMYVDTLDADEVIATASMPCCGALIHTQSIIRSRK